MCLTLFCPVPDRKSIVGLSPFHAFSASAVRISVAFISLRSLYFFSIMFQFLIFAYYQLFGIFPVTTFMLSVHHCLLSPLPFWRLSFPKSDGRLFQVEPRVLCPKKELWRIRIVGSSIGLSCSFFPCLFDW